MGRRAASLLLGAALALGACSAGDDLATEVTSTTTTTAAPTTTAPPTTSPPRTVAPLLPTGDPPPALPLPQPLPTDPWAATPEVVLGTIEIPRIGLSDQLREGMTLTSINRGPSAWPGTARPGGLGNLVVAGHRTTWSAPFHDLDLLQPGDEMVLTTGEGRFVYRVTGSDVVVPDATHIALQTYGHTATLFACHPKGSAAQRIVVRLELVGDDGRPVDDTSDLAMTAAPADTPPTPVPIGVADPLAQAEG